MELGCVRVPHALGHTVVVWIKLGRREDCQPETVVGSSCITHSDVVPGLSRL